MPAPDRNEQLTAKQDEAILALLNEPSIRKAAESIGVDHKTLYRWLEQPLFGDAYRKARRETFSQAISMSNFLARL